MFFGLPLRTMNETTEVVTRPLFGVSAQSARRCRPSTRRVDVGLDRERHDVGLQPGLDGAALVAGGAERRLEADALAGVGLLEGRDDLVVDDLRASSRRRARSCRSSPRTAAASPRGGRVAGAAAAAGDGERDGERGEHGEQEQGRRRAGLMRNLRMRIRNMRLANR